MGTGIELGYPESSLVERRCCATECQSPRHQVDHATRRSQAVAKQAQLYRMGGTKMKQCSILSAETMGIHGLRHRQRPLMYHSRIVRSDVSLLVRINWRRPIGDGVSESSTDSEVPVVFRCRIGSRRLPQIQSGRPLSARVTTAWNERNCGDTGRPNRGRLMIIRRIERSDTVAALGGTEELV